MDSSFLIDLLKLFAVGLLVLANAFFVAAEFSLVSVRRTRIRELITQGSNQAKWVQIAINNPDRVIAATQLGITIASLGLGWIGEPALAHLIYPVVTLFPESIHASVSHSLSAGIAFAMITFLHVVIGELAPKSIALQNPERTSLAIAKPTVWIEWLFKPLIWLLNGTGNAILRFINVKPAAGTQLVHSVEELKMLVSASAQEGVFKAEEGDMLHAIFTLSNLLVRQVMIPRTEIIAVEADEPLRQVISLVTKSTYTKFPVYDDNLDQILGIVHVKDILAAMQEANFNERTIRSITRETIFVPESIPVNILLQRFRDHRQHIAIVLDEYGGTAGLVTLEDLLEEIVGEVSDPFDKITPDIQILADGTVLVSGLTLIDEVNQNFGYDLHDPDYDTIAGFFLGKLGHIPKVHESIDVDGLRLRVESLDGMRIAYLSIKKIE